MWWLVRALCEVSPCLSGLRNDPLSDPCEREAEEGEEPREGLAGREFCLGDILRGLRG